MRKNIRFIALMLLCSIFSTTVSATDLGSRKINTDNDNSISAQDNVVGKKFAVDVLDINNEYAEATISGISSEYNVVVSRSNIETVNPTNGKYSFILNETYAVSIDYEQSGSKYYSYFEFEIDNSGNVVYGNSMNNEAVLDSGFSSSNVTRAAGTIYETESNNSFTTADRTYDDYDNYGHISAANDKDYWVVSFDYAGSANFWLGNVPTGCNYDITVYDSNHVFVRDSCNAGSSQELITIDVEANTNYYIYVNGYNTYDTTNRYCLRVKLYSQSIQPETPITYTHYSTWSMNFNTNNLEYLKNEDVLNENNINEDGVDTDSWYYIIHDEGCVMGSYAMILSNLGKRTSTQHLDVRNNSTTRNYLDPDPFTVTLANTNFPEIIKHSNTKYEAKTNAYPVIAYHQRIANAFGTTAYEITLPSTADDDYMADTIAYYLSLNPEGVAVFFGNATNNHTIVITSTTHSISPGFVPPTTAILSTEVGEEIMSCSYDVSTFNVRSAIPNTYNDKFTVYDPSNSTGGIPFSDSWTAGAKGWSSIYRIVIFD